MAIYPCTAAFKRVLCVRSRSKLQRSIERPSGFYEVCAILITSSMIGSA